MDYQPIPDYEMNSFVASKLVDPEKLEMLVANCGCTTATGTCAPIAPARLNAVLSVSQQRWPQGVGVYIYSMLTDDQIHGLSEGPFSTPAKPLWRRMGSENKNRESRQ